MRAKFYWHEKDCKQAFYFEVADEIMIEENNMAVFYCPFCTSKLMKSCLPKNPNGCDITENKVQGNSF
jgi:hypothetical protein